MPSSRRNLLQFMLLILALVALPAFAQEIAPDVLLKRVTEEVLGAIRQDKAIQAGDAAYRSAFSEEVRNRGIDGLIGTLSSKNRI
jgi:ABC-type transporter MlaC component